MSRTSRVSKTPILLRVASALAPIAVHLHEAVEELMHTTVSRGRLPPPVIGGGNPRGGSTSQAKRRRLARRCRSTGGRAGG